MTHGSRTSRLPGMDLKLINDPHRNEQLVREAVRADIHDAILGIFEILLDGNLWKNMRKTNRGLTSSSRWS